jgi:hypothetical protein
LIVVGAWRPTGFGLGCAPEAGPGAAAEGGTDGAAELDGGPPPGRAETGVAGAVGGLDDGDDPEPDEDDGVPREGDEGVRGAVIG